MYRRTVLIVFAHKLFDNLELRGLRMKGFAGKTMICYDLPTMKQKLWITFVTCLAWCIDRELYKPINCLRQQIQVLVELQEKRNKRNRLNLSQRMLVAVLSIALFLTCQSSIKGILNFRI